MNIFPQDSSSIFFIVSGEPIPQARARVTRYVTYDPCKEKKAFLRLKMDEYMISNDKKPFEGPIAIEMIFDMPIPKSISKKKLQEILDGKDAHTKRPDLDNMCKFLMDSALGIFYLDDSQICSLRAIKRYSKTPRTVISITSIPI